MPGNKNRLKLRMRAPGLIITTPASVSGPVGQALSVAVTAATQLAEISILSSTGNIALDAGQLFAIDTTAAGFWSCTIAATDIYGRSATKTIGFTVSGGAALGALTNVLAPVMGQTTATFSYTLPGGATTAQVAVNSTQNLPYTLNNSLRKLSVLEPLTAYDFFLRATDGVNFGPWSATVSGTTLASGGGPQPPATAPLRAIQFTDSLMVNMYLNRASGDPYTAAAVANSVFGSDYATTTWDNTGWLMGHFEPLAKAGIRRIRSSFGSSQAASHQSVQIPQKAFASCYGTRLDGTITQLTAAQLAQAGLTGTSAETAITRARNAYAQCLRTLQGLNEPNNTAEPWFNSSAAYPGGWRSIVIDHEIATYQHLMTLIAGFPSDLQKWMFSLWKRDIDDARALMFVDYNGGNFTPYTTAAGNQWTRDALPKNQASNLHAYTGGRKPTLLGTPGKQFSETGDPYAEITLDDQLLKYAELANGNTSFPIAMTENGWELGGVGLRTAFADAWLTENARIKYYQRQWFDNLKRGVIASCIFELIDNDSQVPAGNTGGKVYGLLSYTRTGTNTYSFTRRKLWFMSLLSAAALFDGNLATGAISGTAWTFAKADLAFALDNQAGGAVDSLVRTLLFQGSDGKYRLAMWRDSEVWKRTGPFSAANETFTSVPVRITLGTSKSFRTTRPYADAQASALANTWSAPSNGTTFNLTCFDDVTIVEIS